jgi:cytosine/adenosine deaminase-related metal-dependent hydrolase
MDRKRVDLIIEGGVVVTMDPRHRIIHDGAVAVDGKAIAAVGTRQDLRQAFEAGKILDARHKAIMPGLVDTYGHAGHGMVKAIRHPELGWPTNHLYFHAADEGWWSAEGLLSAVERLKFGVTCGLTVVGATPARMDSPVFAIRQAEAVESVGTRGVLGVGPPDPYVTHLPEPWEGTLWQEGKPVRRRFTYEQTLRNSISVIESWHGAANGRVRVALHYPYLFGRHASHPKFPFTYADEHLPVVIEKADEMRDLADRYGVLLHSHAFRGSVTFGLKVFGPERVRRLLGPDVVLAHCNDLAEDEVRVLGEEGVNVALVPFTAENIVHGVCPAIELLQAGANVTISTDGTAPYCSYDLFKEISRAMWAQWTRLNDFRLLPPGKALRMVTIDAARALGLDDQIGSLEVGKRADIILVDMNRPHLVPRSTVPRLLAFYANGNDVDTVLVDGKVLMQDRQVLSVDVGAILDGAREAADRAFSRFDVSPYLETDEDFWLGWRH